MITDQNIIRKLYKKTKNNTLNWYKTNSSDILDIWKSSEKITNSKALSYIIYHKKDKPYRSHIVIYLEKRLFNGINTITMKKIKTIKNSIYIILLLRLSMQKSGDLINKKVVSIIQNKNNSEEILLVKNYKEWTLPGGKINYNETMDNAIIRTVKEKTNIEIKTKDLLQYRNIFILNGEYYTIYPYLVYDYEGSLYNFPKYELEKYKWVNKSDLFNWMIDDETMKIIIFLNEKNIL